MKNLLEPYKIGSAQSTALVGYDTKNYRIEDSSGRKFVLKHYTDNSEYNVVTAESEIIRLISGNLSFHVPLSFPVNGKTLHQYPDRSFSRLMHFIEGKFLSEIKHPDLLLNNFGKATAELNLALKGLRSPVIEGRKHHWDLQHCLLNKSRIRHIKKSSQRKLVEYFFDQFEFFVLPELSNLRHSIIHGDLNDWNILTDGEKITGVIDFGDICYSPLINELAIALSYIMFGKDNPLEAGKSVLQGYHSVYPLTEKEIKLLYFLIPARWATTVSNSAEAKAKGSDTEYILICEKPAWESLERWISFNPLAVQNTFLQATEFQPVDFIDKKNLALELRIKHTGKSLGLSYSAPIYIQGAAFQYMYDGEGNTYLDARNNIPHVGHCHPKISQAISKQVRLLNTNTRYLYDALAHYSEMLFKFFPEKLCKVFYVNSGSAATDLAIRLAQTYTNKTHQLVLENGYHGNTLAGINISSYKFDGKGGSGLPPNITKLPLPTLYNGKYSSGEDYARDAKRQIDELISGDIFPSTFIAEPISGCGGQVPLAEGYMKTLKPYLQANNIVTIADEVQTGFGRLGDFFWGFEMHGIIPEIVILGKPMGNGHPIAAVVTTEEIAAAFANGMEFFSSIGGNPVSCEAAIAVLEVLEEEQLQNQAQEVGNYLKSQIVNLKDNYPVIGDVRGLGLFLGIEFSKPGSKKPYPEMASRVKNSMKEHFILTSTDGPCDNVLKIKPPLCFNKKNAGEFIERLERILKQEFQC